MTESDGIHVFGNIPDLRAADPELRRDHGALLVYGSAPAWGPADVPGARPAPAPPPGGRPREAGRSRWRDVVARGASGAARCACG